MLTIESNSPTRDPQRPLQVYLDSSDYSVLSEAMVDTDHPHAETFRTLSRHVDQGKIEIRYSSIHVIEIAHLDADSRHYALRRAECLRKLTGGKCFRFWSEICARECINLLSNRPVYENTVSNDGYWHPDLSETAETLKETLIDEFRTLGVRSRSVVHWV